MKYSKNVTRKLFRYHYNILQRKRKVLS